MQPLDRLIEAGLPHVTGRSAAELRRLGRGLGPGPEDAIGLHPDLVPAAALTPLLRRGSKSGFVVSDLTDLGDFVPTVELPSEPLYVLKAPDRGLDLRNWSPAEALAELARRGRRPLTVHEGMGWLLQQPELLQPNECFMCIGSRKPKGSGFDARTPALWISGGTGRDGRERAGAPKLGWCWWNNRHTWLGFASAA